MGAAVRLTHVAKRYHDFYAVKDLSLDIAPGECLTLLGPSGSGKTTTLMMLAGLLEATSGDITIDGRDITHLPPHRRDIGVVFQNYALFPHMSVFDNIAFPLRRRRVPGAEVERRVTSILELVQLAGLGARRIGQISGGQQQRVALARALVFEPPLLLMDEPLGALDRKLREQMQLEMKDIMARLGVTVIYVTHDQDEALTLSDRVAVFRAGQLEQLGTPEELYARPATAFVADFVGSTNLLEARVLTCSGGIARARTAGGLALTVSVTAAAVPAQALAISLRPERIRLQPATQGPCDGDSVDRVVGRVRERMFAGATVKFRVDANGHDFIVHTDNNSELGKIKKGDQVILEWCPDDAHVVSLGPATDAGVDKGGPDAGYQSP